VGDGGRGGNPIAILNELRIELPAQIVQVFRDSGSSATSKATSARSGVARTYAAWPTIRSRIARDRHETAPLLGLERRHVRRRPVEVCAGAEEAEQAGLDREAVQ
jgi:hypothetical protein